MWTRGSKWYGCHDLAHFFFYFSRLIFINFLLIDYANLRNLMPPNKKHCRTFINKLNEWFLLMKLYGKIGYYIYFAFKAWEKERSKNEINIVLKSNTTFSFAMPIWYNKTIFSFVKLKGRCECNLFLLFFFFVAFVFCFKFLSNKNLLL